MTHSYLNFSLILTHISIFFWFLLPRKNDYYFNRKLNKISQNTHNFVCGGWAGVRASARRSSGQGKVGGRASGA